MNAITQILTIAISFSLLLIAYFKYMRNKPRLRIIKLNQSSASTFSGFNEKIKFNYKNEIYEEISAIEIIINNNGFRAIEKEDIRTEEPLEIFTEEYVDIKDFSIIKKHGSSNVELVKIDNQILRLNIISFDKGSSIRVKLLYNKGNPKIFARGKIIKADKSIAKIKDLKGGDLKNAISNLFVDFRIILKIFLVISLIISALMTIPSVVTLKPTAIVFAPNNFYTRKQQMFFLDSLINSANEKTKLKLNVIKDTTLYKSYEFLHVYADVDLSWRYNNDSIAKNIHDSLDALGYTTYYSDENPNSYTDYKLNSNNHYKSGHNIKTKEIIFDDYINSITIGFYGLFGVIIVFHILFLIIEFRYVRYYLSYRHFLSEDEIKEIREKHSKHLISKPFLWFLPK